MVATSLFSFALLALAGVLLDAHRRDWDRARVGGSDPDQLDSRSDALRFARGRFMRRLTATGAIGLVGALVALWPILPRRPGWVMGYTGTLALLALVIMALGFADAWASSRRSRAETQLLVREEHARLAAALRQAGASRSEARDSDA